MNKYKSMLVLMVVLISIQTVIALRNPAAVYCEALGYKYSNGFCIFPDGNRIEAWKFLLGEAGEEYSYCAKHGYELRIIEDPNQCLVLLSNKCAGCLLPNGSVVEVTKLMNLSFKETVCGDGKCGFPENYKTCPQDCPSGSMDMYCDGVPDGICDPDCDSTTDIDCNVCGNNKCEAFENYTNCCIDCKCPEGFICKNNKCIEQKCGNKVCESYQPYNENYKTCPQDCPSGSMDMYCDGVPDGICDPDCEKLKKFDPDCSPKNNLWIYIILIAVLVFVIIVYYETKIKSNTNTDFSY